MLKIQREDKKVTVKIMDEKGKTTRKATAICLTREKAALLARELRIVYGAAGDQWAAMDYMLYAQDYGFLQ